MISFAVDCVPVAQPRQRVRVVGKGDGSSFAQNYTPKAHPVTAFKDAVHLASAGSVLHLMAHGGMLTGPLEVRLTFVMPRPKKLGKGGRAAFNRKPDFDNLAKSVCDALNQRVWVDDSQVCRCVVEKWYAASEERPHVLVEVLPLDQPKGA